MSLDQDVIVVSGLPRSGTSLMMQMLERGGIEVATDHQRTADVDNPAGYFELERVKDLAQDSSWIPTLRGKAVKMISMLLYDLPLTERYRIVFMERNLDEVIASQEKMLRRRQQQPAPQAKMREAFELHLRRLSEQLEHRKNTSVLRVSYRELVETPLEQAQAVSRFLDDRPIVNQMVTAVDSALYRNRKPSESQNTDPG